MNIDPNYAICVYRDNPKQIIDYIKDSLGFDVFVGPGNNISSSWHPHSSNSISIFLLDNNKNSLIELYFYWHSFYLWTKDTPRLLDDQYCVNYTPVSNIINRFLHVYHNYRRQQKIDHQQDIKQAGLVYDV
jgi:hypothetical protein